MTDDISMRAGNAGLTVKVNLWALDKWKDETSALDARLAIRGQVTHADTREVKKFNDAGELITILGKWNATKLRDLKARQ